MRLGWPSGFDKSHVILPLKPVSLTIRFTKSFIDISKPAPIFIGSLLLYFSVARTIASAQSSTYKNSRVAFPVPQTVISGTVPCGDSPFALASRHFLIRAGIT